MAALSLRQKQLDLIVRMLHLNQPPPPPGTAAEQEEEVYKILVLDSFCLSLLSPLLRVADLRKHGVTLFFPIDKPRQQVPDAPAVYFLRPTQANADRVAADAAAALYATFHLNFSSALPRPLLDRLASAAAAAGSAHRVARLADQYLDFVSLEDNLFSLAHPRSYVALNDPRAADADIEALVDAIALGLFCVVATLGTVPIIRCARGGPAEMVAAALDARLRDHLLAKPNLFTEASAASFQRPVLCLFDRNFELSVGIQHDWSYRPLVHDVLGLNLNKLKMPADKSGPAKTYDLDDSDAFWVANSWSPFPRVAEEIEAQLAKYKQDVDEVNQRTGGGKDGVEFDGADLIGNTKHLMNAVSSLPELTERKKMIDKHTNIATVLLGHIKERSLDAYCDCENDMLVKGTVDRNTLLGLLRGKGTKEDKLRLAVTYLLSFEAPPPSELEQVEAALRESEVDMSAFHYVKRIKSLNTQFSCSSSTASKSNIVDWAEKLLYGQSISAVTAGVKNLLSAGRQLALTRTVEALMEGKPNPEVDNYLLFDPRAPRPGSGQFKGPFREAIVFMIGGGNYMEYRSLMELAERSQPTKHVIYGATEVLNGVEFVEQLAELGQKAGLGGGSSNPPSSSQ
ncbi:SEC1 family transport protein SLY1 [Dichanthelium oligosanthes]|uniref:SEC1 family transport protein SLY1 n=1 Tax=Dichanthelium oligosanthes TaxID=888268 RepID=A0A1E5V0L6_9POAL|nr:SEC1 family transport protein SLY1 [Dichanthelium oligosanthes]